jgi:hypothetical protein
MDVRSRWTRSRLVPGGRTRRRWLIAATLAVMLVAPSARAQEPPPTRQCPEMLTCRVAEVNLQNYLSLPLTFQGQSSCAQFCSADYWVRHAGTGAVLLQFGHGGPMGPPLLAWGFLNDVPPAVGFRLRQIVWVSRPDTRAIDDGWYEETTYTWDAVREVLVGGMVRRLEPEQGDRLPRRLENEGMRVLFTR